CGPVHAPFTVGQQLGKSRGVVWLAAGNTRERHAQRANRGTKVTYRAEYIWIDGTAPTAKLRSKTKVIVDGEPGIWGFDGSSTNQAPGSSSDCVLRPVFTCPDPIRGGDDKLVLCEVLDTDMTPHPSNTRALCAEVAERYASQEPWFGIEQEYTFLKD